MFKNNMKNVMKLKKKKNILFFTIVTILSNK